MKERRQAEEEAEKVALAEQRSGDALRLAKETLRMQQAAHSHVNDDFNAKRQRLDQLQQRLSHDALDGNPIRGSSQDPCKLCGVLVVDHRSLNRSLFTDR